MRTAILVIGVILLTAGSVSADEPQPKADAVNRGLTFLAKDAVKWKEERKCSSCHHAGMIVWAMNEAQQSGYKVDQPVLADLTKWLIEAGDGRTSVERPASAPKAHNSKALWYSLALGSVPSPSEDVVRGHQQLLETVRSDQLKTGALQAWPETRAPFSGESDYSTTALAAVAFAAPSMQAAEFQNARDKAVKWLETASIDGETQSISLRLLLAGRLKQATIIPSATADLLSHQNPDGGWSQTKEMKSDAWATGQALLALKTAKDEGSDEAIARGEKFLIEQQREDGSWPMESRPSKPGGKAATNLMPIIGAGSAWAVIGLSTEQK